MQLNSYLHFNGDCEEALKFYAQCLGGKIDSTFTYADSPMAEQTPPELRGKIMHARLIVGGNVLMASDALCGRYQKPAGFWVSIGVDDPAEAERIYAALSENGSVIMPLEETFWAQRFAMLVDRFGTPWMINCEKRG